MKHRKLLTGVVALGLVLILAGTVQAVRKPPVRLQGEPPPRVWETPAPPPIPTAENSPVPGGEWECTVTIGTVSRTCQQELATMRVFHILGGGVHFATYREQLVNSNPPATVSGHMGVLRNAGNIALLSYSDLSNWTRVIVQSERVFPEGIDVWIPELRITGGDCDTQHRCHLTTVWP